MEKREILKETELFVLDMDGTFYLDTDVLYFLRIIRRNLRKHILTNWQKWGVILKGIRSLHPGM